MPKIWKDRSLEKTAEEEEDDGVICSPVVLEVGKLYYTHVEHHNNKALHLVCCHRSPVPVKWLARNGHAGKLFQGIQVGGVYQVLEQGVIKKRENQSSGVWQEGGTLGPGCSLNGCATSAVSSTRNCIAGSLTAIQYYVYMCTCMWFLSWATCICVHVLTYEPISWAEVITTVRIMECFHHSPRTCGGQSLILKGLLNLVDRCCCLFRTDLILNVLLTS